MECLVDVKGSDGAPSSSDFEDEIVPQIKNDVVNYVLDHEVGQVLPITNIDFHVVDFKWKQVREGSFHVKMLYRQKINKTREHFHHCFKDQVENKKRVFVSKSGKEFSFHYCKNMSLCRW